MVNVRQSKLRVSARTSSVLKWAVVLSIATWWSALGGQLFVGPTTWGRPNLVTMHGTATIQASEVVDLGFREERNLTPEQQESLGVERWEMDAYDAGEKFGMEYSETTSVYIKSGEVEIELDPGVLECVNGHKPGDDAEYCETTVVTLGAGDLALFSPGVGCEWRIKQPTELKSHEEKGYRRLAHVPTAKALQRMLDGEERKRDFFRSRVLRWLRVLKGASV